MSDGTPLTVSVNVTNGGEMRAKFLGREPFTYHHFLPVRTYYLTASALLQVVGHPDAPRQVFLDGREALFLMARNHGDGNDLLGFLLGRRQGGPISAARLHAMAKLCTTPRFGGFLGPEGNTRANDPGAFAETTRPQSVGLAGWQHVQSLRGTVQDAFGLMQAPEPGLEQTATKALPDWWAWARAASRDVKGAYLALNAATRGSVWPFAPSDWSPDPGFDWSYVPPEQAPAAANGSPVTMKLRQASDPDRHKPVAGPNTVKLYAHDKRLYRL